MKRFCTLLFILTAFSAALMAQTTFSVSATQVWTIAPHHEPDVEGHFTITNTTNSTQTIRWTRTEVEKTAGCYTQVCDLNLCYTPIVSTKTFDIPANTSGNIIMHFLNYDSIVGASGIIRLKMSNENNPADSVNVTFLFTSPLSGAADLPLANVKVYPNPTTDFFQLENADAVSRIRVFSAEAREVARFTATPGERYALASQPAGNYFLALEDNQGRVFQRIHLVKK
ncbi:MAG: T9SS type A sorting domain-containing protein [Saprospiraceae bacterium]|nr:T9SS type A sorting domain-containing protein [Saprospiraceae bacterium]